MTSAVAEVLGHRRTGIGREKLHRCRIGRRSGNDRGVLHGAVTFQGLHDLDNGGAFLTNGHIKTLHIFSALVDDRVDRQSGFSGFAVANDQLALPTANRGQRINHLDPGLHRFVNVFPFDNPRGFDLNLASRTGVNGRAAVDGDSKCVNHTAEQLFAHGNGRDGFGALDFVAFLDAGIVTKNGDPYIVGFQVKRSAAQAVFGELHQLSGHYAAETVYPCDSVTDTEDGSDFVGFDGGGKLLQLLAQDGGHLIGFNIDGHGANSLCVNHVLFKLGEFRRNTVVLNPVADSNTEARNQGIVQFQVGANDFSGFLTEFFAEIF